MNELFGGSVQQMLLDVLPYLSYFVGHNNGGRSEN
jgi:hypothetical protein